MVSSCDIWFANWGRRRGRRFARRRGQDSLGQIVNVGQRQELAAEAGTPRGYVQLHFRGEPTGWFWSEWDSQWGNRFQFGPARPNVEPDFAKAGQFRPARPEFSREQIGAWIAEDEPS